MVQHFGVLLFIFEIKRCILCNERCKTIYKTRTYSTYFNVLLNSISFKPYSLHLYNKKRTGKFRSYLNFIVSTRFFHAINPDFNSQHKLEHVFAR